VKNDGGTLVLENVNDEIKNIFTITGFHKLFTIK
jgi:anti-anti-sigma regulatory factor